MATLERLLEKRGGLLGKFLTLRKAIDSTKTRLDEIDKFIVAAMAAPPAPPDTIGALLQHSKDVHAAVASYADNVIAAAPPSPMKG